MNSSLEDGLNDIANVCMRADLASEVRQHIAALETRLADEGRQREDGIRDREAVMRTQAERIHALDQHISELEKSLENVRAELDSARARCNGLGCGACSVCVQQARDDAETARKERDEALRKAEIAEQDARVKTLALGVDLEAAKKALGDARAEIARLKPSGKVATSMTLIRQHMDPPHEPECLCAACSAHRSLVTIAAKAQGYEALTAVCAAISKSVGFTGPTERLAAAVESAMQEGRKTLAEYQHAERERISAVADNAALLAVLRDAVMAMEHACDTLNDMDAVDPEEDAEAMSAVERVTDAMERIDARDHPGAALLERMKRLEEALGYFMLGKCICLAGGCGEDDVHSGKCAEFRILLGIPGKFIAPIILTTPSYTARITGISDPTCADGSCAKCRSGEPCH